ncbi:MAG: hypothetical protein ABIJ45_07560 [Candidatus Zixiibacteriota bacterium]
MTKFIWIILIILLPLMTMANDFKLGRSSGLSGAVLLSDPTPSEKILCPVASFTNDRFSIESGFDRQYELSDLDEIYLAANYSFSDLSIDLGFSQFGKSEYYTEQLLKISTAYRYKYFSLSILASNKLLKITTENNDYSLSAFSVGAAVGLHYKNYYAAVVVNNLNQPELDKGTEPEKTITDLYAEIESPKYFSVVGRIRLEQDQKEIYSIGQNFKFNNGINLFWGVQANPVKYSGGFKYSRFDFSIIYTLSHHPVLGFSHNVSLSYFTGGVRK